MKKLEKEFLDIFACPKCKGDLIQKKMFLVCENCKLAFPILDEDIPDLLLEDCWKLEDAEKENFEHNLKL